MPSSYTLGDHFESFIRTQIESGRYASASEVLRDALRLLEDQEKLRALHVSELRAAIRKGIESGTSVPADAVFDRLEKKYRRTAKARKG